MPETEREIFKGKANKWGVHPPNSLDESMQAQIAKALQMGAAPEELLNLLPTPAMKQMLANEIAISTSQEDMLAGALRGGGGAAGG